MAGYHNPVAHAVLTAPKRVDEGVDYDVHGGWLSAVADGVMIGVSGTFDPSEPGYALYRVTQPGTLHGLYIYYAEGITNPRPAGQVIYGGNYVCGLSTAPGANIEIGFGSSDPPNSWARQYGAGYDQETSTGAGAAFNKLIGLLGGEQGIIQGTPYGGAPDIDWSQIKPGAGGGTGPTGPAPVGPAPKLPPVPPVKDYDASPIIRNAFWQFGVHGYRAQNNARYTLNLAKNVSYCDADRAHP
jgi:hypothetical protein